MAFRFQHVIDDRGWHSIRDRKTGNEGGAAGYQGIATFTDPDTRQRYFAVTDYHADGRVMRSGVVYAFKPIEQ